MSKKIVSSAILVLATLSTVFGLAASPQVVKAFGPTDIKIVGEAGEIAFIPTCAWSFPEGYYSKTSAYTYLGRIPVSEPASKYPGVWECTSVIKHMIRLNYTTLWSPLSTKYGTTPAYFRIRSMGTNPANPAAGLHTDQYYDINSVEVLNHFYADSLVAYQSTGSVSFSLKQLVNGVPVAISNSGISYTLDSTNRCVNGVTDRINCRWIHKFSTASLQTGTYRIDFTDTNSSGVGASKGGLYQIFFYLTR